jgi:hypothetical protein
MGLCVAAGVAALLLFLGVALLLVQQRSRPSDSANDQSGLTEATRKRIFVQLVEPVDKLGTGEACQKAWERLRSQNGIDYRATARILDEGIKKNWPMPELPTDNGKAKANRTAWLEQRAKLKAEEPKLSSELDTQIARFKGASDEDADRIARLETEMKREEKWANEFVEAIKGDKKADNIARLKAMGLILKIDHEAKNAVVDDRGWQTISKIAHGRELLTRLISDDVAAHNSDNPEVTLFSSETGKSLSWLDSDFKIHIFR